MPQELQLFALPQSNKAINSKLKKTLSSLSAGTPTENSQTSNGFVLCPTTLNSAELVRFFDELNSNVLI